MSRPLLPVPRAREGLSKMTVGLQVLAALVLMWPVLQRIQTHVPGKSGLADLPGTLNLHWLVHEVGISGVTHTRMLMYPSTVDRVVIDGFPLDALLSWPFLAIFGWPAGFTVFIAVAMVALGCATAWLAQCWWGDERAAFVAGVVAQASPFLTREMLQGRPTQLVGAIFLPLGIGLLLRSLTRGSARDAGLGGGAIGLGALCYWYYGAFFAIAVGLLLLVARLDGRPVLTTIWASTLGCLIVAGVPALYAFQGLGDMPGADIRSTDTLLHGGEQISLVQLLELRDLINGIRTDGVLALQCAVIVLVGVCLVRAPLRRWLLPLLWMGVALLLAAGPLLVFPTGGSMPGPFALFAEVPGLRRMWWPDRSLVIIGPAVALMAGGGVIWVADRFSDLRWRRWGLGAAVVGLILFEAQWVVASLPVPSAWAAPTVRSNALAEGTGPVLILPLGGGAVQQDAQMLIDQIHHGRPLVNGPMPPDSTAAPAAYLDFVGSIGMDHFVQCETAGGRVPEVTRAMAWTHFRQHGIREIYLDRELARKLVVGGETYRSCVQMLIGPASRVSDPYLIYVVP